MDKLKSYNIQKFDGNNFQLWKYQLQIIFRAEKVLDIVEGKPRPNEAGESQDAWDDLNAKAMLILSTAMEFDQLQCVMTCANAAEMWARLKIIHEQRSAVNKMTLKQKFFDYRMSPTDTIAQHISKVESLVQALADIGEPVKEVDKMAKILGSLPARFATFSTAWDSCAEDQQTFDNLTSRLLKEEQKLLDGDEKSTAFAAVNTYNTSKYNSKNKSSSTINRKDVECYYCHKRGHFKSECRKLLAKLETKTDDTSEHQALSAEQENVYALGCENVWLADSAASKHMTSHKDWFKTFNAIQVEDSYVQIGDNSIVKAEGIGSIELLALVDGKWEPRTLENTLYIPKLRKNLFSVGAVTKRGMKVSFDDKRMEVRNSRLVAVGIKMDNQCYKMLFKRPDILQANPASLNSTMLWHERLGHIHFKGLKNMADMNLIPGLKMKSDEELQCESCQYGKMKRQSFNSNLESRSKIPGEFIHADLSGWMREPSVGGAHVYIVLKDDCTSYRFVYFLKSKRDTFPVFLEFQKLIERQTGNKIRVLRSDNGTEFINKQFEDYFKQNGIIHERSSPYTPQQNGRIERENRSIAECARTMLLSTDLSHELWAEAVNCAAYILNRRPCKANNSVTPYEKWFGKPPSLKHMRKFGSAAYVHVPDQFRSKWDSKSRKLIMVGYDGYSTNYRLYNPESKKIIISSNVSFNEEETCGLNIEQKYAEFYLGDHATEGAQDESEEDPASKDAQEESEEDGTRNRGKQSETMELRDRSNLQAPARFRDQDIACSAIIFEPQTFEEAMASHESSKWKQAMEEEMTSLKKNKTWDLVPLPHDRKAVGCKWVYRVKQNSEGKIDRFKARLCAKGYSQREGIDYEETFSPVVRYDSVRVLLAIAASKDMEIRQFDVKTAFLNGDLKEEVYMEQPKGFVSKGSNFVCKLKKSLYGLKQSPRCWNQKFVQFLTMFGFKQMNADNCVFHALQDDVDVYLALYVDDGLLISKSLKILENILTTLGATFEITVGDGKYFCGLEIEHNHSAKEIYIGQQGYISRLLQKFNMDDSKPNSTPFIPGIMLHSGQSPANQYEIKEMENKPYRQVVGSLMFAATVSRPDIMFAVSMVSRFLNNPGVDHWNAAKRIMKYLQGTKDMTIRYKAELIELVVYSDADFAGDYDTRRSTTGYVSLLANGPVSWCSRRQKCVTRSTTEAEYIAASDAASESVWLRDFLCELGFQLDKPTTLCIDNQSAIRLIKNTEHHKRTKHIDIKYHYIREQVENNVIKVCYVCSEKQLADMFTKPLTRDKFISNRKALSIISKANSIKQEWEC